MSRGMEKAGSLYLGLDVGSVSLNTVVMNSKEDILEERYDRIKGQPLRVVDKVLSELVGKYGADAFSRVCVTGIGGELVAELLGGAFVNEIVAQAIATKKFHPQVRTIIEMGGEDSKLILLKPTTEDDFEILDFSMNTLCAAGTGSFLDQQASRLNLNVEDFGRLALKSKSPPRIAGRCSVFAKSDMIHLQQAAAPDYDIVAGLCFAVARNFKGTICQGMKLEPPVSFQGGVAANLGVRRAFKEILKLGDDELIIPEHFASMGAIGAVLVQKHEPAPKKLVLDLGRLRDYLENQKPDSSVHKPLKLSEAHLTNTEAPVGIPPDAEIPIDAYLGVDVGSISTNVVVIDEKKRVLAKAYLMTAGRPLEAIKEGLRIVGRAVGDKVRIVGAGATGSGRYLTGDFIGADVVRNEITAQATASADIDPEVDTIFEIGGQDSKYISLSNGAIVDFEMNKVCAAGTGSFLEEQAEKLGISIKEEFGNLALSAKNPVKLGERCTVFMESDLVHHQQRGAQKDDLVAGLCYSIVENYLNRVVGDKHIGKRIFFQGGTAFNKGVVAAFESVLGQPVTVPPHHDVTGAIGVAIIAMQERNWEKSKFKGFQLSEAEYEITSFECKDCPNHCEVRKVTIKGEKRPLFYGSRCEKYDLDRKMRTIGEEIPDLFSEREEFLLGGPDAQSHLPEDAPVIGIPWALNMHELYPFWRTFFNELGFRVVLSDRTTKQLIHRGIEKIISETCFPVKVAHGHVQNLLDKGVKKIFIPSVIDARVEGQWEGRGYYCPYVQTIPYVIKAAFNFKEYGAELLTSYFYMGREWSRMEDQLIELADRLGKGQTEAIKAARAARDAQDEFSEKCRKRGMEVLERLPQDRIAMVIVSRPYNGCDLGINLDLPKKLKNLGVMAIPLDFLPLDRVERVPGMEHMYWRYGQCILAGAHFIKDDERLYPIYITNFGCGPDSFIQHFFKNRLSGKPFLLLEFDEHSADAGVVTRLEAFLDSLKNVRKVIHKIMHVDAKVNRMDKSKLKRTIYLPYMTDQAYALAAAFEACGVKAEVLPESDEETLYWGRKLTSGRECYPCILTTGDMAKMVMRKDFDRKRAAFFMPSGTGPCRFGQYNTLHRMVLDELGYPDVPIVSPVQDEALYQQLGMVGGGYARLAWRAIVAIDLLQKKLFETRPYAKDPEEAERVYRKWMMKVYEATKNREDLIPVLRAAREEMDRIELKEKPGERPLIGIVGEIYIRSNPFSNENIVEEVEKLGGAVWMPPIGEWILYINFTSRRNAIRQRNYKNLISNLFNSFFQHKDEKVMEEVFHDSVMNLHEPPIKETLRKASPYLHDSFEGEAILSIGKSIDFIEKGVSGIINVMPFTCMPGTIVSALLKAVKKDYDNIPILNMPFDGQQQTNTQTRLEAFIYQAKQFKKIMSDREFEGRKKRRVRL